MVKYPEMRRELVETIQTLADREYQHKAWVKKEFPAPVKYDCFDYAVHFLYDDATLANNVEKAIGQLLENENEADAIRQVIAALERVFARLGTEATDEEYISCSEWDQVIEAAAAASLVLQGKFVSR